MARIVTADDLRATLGRELDALRESEEALYVSKRGRLAGVLLDPDRYAELIERLEYLADSLAALQARGERDLAVPWSEARAQPPRRSSRTRSASTPRRRARIGVSRSRYAPASRLRSTVSPTSPDRPAPRGSRAATTTGSASGTTASCMRSRTPSAS